MQFNKEKLVIILVFALVFFGGYGSTQAESSSVNIKNEVYYSANTGGNVGENVSTGDATVTSRIINKVTENVQERLETKVEAEATGGTAKVEVNGEEKSCVAEGDETCSVEIGNVENVEGVGNSNDEVNKTEGSGVVEGVEDEKQGVIASAITVFENILDTAFGNLMSIFK